MWVHAGRAHVVDGQCGVAGQCGAAVIGRRGGFGRAGKHSPGKIHFFFRGRLDVRVPLAHRLDSNLGHLDSLKGGGEMLGAMHAPPCPPAHECHNSASPFILGPMGTGPGASRYLSSWGGAGHRYLPQI